MIQPVDRRLTLAGCFNFRDLGGLPAAGGATVRPGRLFRSDALHRLTDDDVDALTGLGVRTLLDLRSEREVEESGVGPLREHGVRHRHLPLTADASGNERGFPNGPMEELYVRFLDEGRPAIRAVFETLSEEETYPAVVHCAAGKDRTGIVVALVLRAVGVPDDEIVADYALTDECMPAMIAGMRAAGRASMLDRVPPTTCAPCPRRYAGCWTDSTVASVRRRSFSATRASTRPRWTGSGRSY